MGRTNRKIQYMAGICAALCFMFTGATLSWSSPAIPKFKSGESHINITDSQCSWVVALLPVGAIPGCFLGHILSEKVGRKKALLFASVPAILGATIIFWTRMPELMYFARFVIGLATGSTAVATMIYITEISDKEIRGSLGMVVQVMNNLGSLLIYSLGPFVTYDVLNGIVLAISLIFLVACSWIPESPYYYLKDEKLTKARKEFMRLKGTKDVKDVEEELHIIRIHVRESMENKTTYKELLSNVRYRKTLGIVAVLKVLQYMTGILAIQAYLEPIFRQSSSVSGPKASIIYGFVQLAAGIVATFLARWLGRRVLMLSSCLGVGICLTLVGTFFFIKDYLVANETIVASISALPLTGILGFVVFFSNGVGNIPYIMQAELFPINVKAQASSLATIFACVMSFLVTKCYHTVKDNFGHYTVFWSFASIAYFGIPFVYFFMPETGNKTLEEVQDDVQEQCLEQQALNRDTDTPSRN